MPKDVMLPGAARLNMAEMAREQLLDRAGHLLLETYTTVGYEGLNGGVPGSGLFVEVDEDSWVENGIFRFQEVSETSAGVVLYDASRNVTISIDYTDGEITVSWPGNQLNWDLVSLSHSATPVIPDGWII